MTDRTPFLMFGRRFHNMFRSTIENGDGSEASKWVKERPVFEHYACGMYLAGCFSYLESTYGKSPWKNGTPNTFDQFISNKPENQRNNFMKSGICENGIAALVCIRNAFVHNNCDLSKNTDKNSLDKVTAENIPGVTLNGSKFLLSSNRTEDFMEFVRLSLVAVAQFNGDG